MSISEETAIRAVRMGSFTLDGKRYIRCRRCGIDVRNRQERENPDGLCGDCISVLRREAYDERRRLAKMARKGTR